MGAGHNEDLVSHVTYLFAWDKRSSVVLWVRRLGI